MTMLSRVSRASLKSLRFAPATTTASGTPLASVSKLRLVPPLALSVGLGPVFFPPEGRLGHRAVHRKPAPVHAHELVVVGQRRHPRTLEHARLGPLDEPSMRRRARADAGRLQCVPLASGAEHEQDCGHCGTVRHARVVASKRMRLARRDQRLDLRPKHVRNGPPVSSLDKSHVQFFTETNPNGQSFQLLTRS